MKIKLKEKILAEMREAYPDNPVFEKDEYYRWHSKEVDSKFLNMEQAKLLVGIFKRPENTEDIEDRRQLRKLNAYVKLLEGKAKRIRNLEQMAEALKMVLRPLPNHWVFVEDDVSDAMVPYLVTEVKFHESEPRSGVEASISIKAVGMRHGSHESVSTTARRASLGDKGCTAPELLERLGLYPETEEFVTEHEEQLARYKGIYKETGLQLVGHGDCYVKSRRKRDEDRYYSSYSTRSRTSLDKGGIVSKLVVDDMEERKDKDSPFVSCRLWSTKHGDDEDEVFNLPVHPYIRVFSLKMHQFTRLHVKNVEVYEYEEGLEDKLVLDDDKRELIDLLVSSGGDDSRDIVQGKSGGVIIVTSGPPGTGKTLTAEVYSEKVKRPLYVVQCSQLGTDPDELEEALEEVLERAVRWNAVLLIDEADVYIHERGDNIQQNAIVGVFLRVLEYYSGVLFLTTNRATVIDDAIESRCIAHVRYELPVADEQRQLWRILSAQYGVPFEEPLIEELVSAFPGISGRSVKQLIRLAKARAMNRGQDITADSIAWVSRFQSIEVTEGDRKKFPVIGRAGLDGPR